MIQFRDEESWKVCGLAEHISPSLCVIFSKKISRAVEVTVVRQHLSRHYSGHHVILTSSYPTRLRIIKGQVAAHCCRNNDELRRNVEKVLTSITPQYFGSCLPEHGGV